MRYKSIFWTVSGIVFCIVFIFYIFSGAFRTRTWEADATGYPGLINYAQLPQYAESVRITADRLIKSGVDPKSLSFNRPGKAIDFKRKPFEVFGPNDGGAVFQDAPAEVMHNNKIGQWFFNMTLNIDGIGTDAADIIAFLPGVSEVVCKGINSKLEINSTPRLDAKLTALYRLDMNVVGKPPNAPTLPMRNKTYACFQDGDKGSFVYYHVIVER